MERKLIPVACTLSADDAVAQAGEWSDLVEHARSTQRVDGGVVVVFDAELEARVRDLAAREAACCGFLSLSTERSADGVRLSITSTDADALPVIELLAGLDRT